MLVRFILPGISTTPSSCLMMRSLMMRSLMMRSLISQISSLARSWCHARPVVVNSILPFFDTWTARANHVSSTAQPEVADMGIIVPQLFHHVSCYNVVSRWISYSYDKWPGSGLQCFIDINVWLNDWMNDWHGLMALNGWIGHWKNGWVDD